MYVPKPSIVTTFLQENISPFPSLTRYRGRSQFTAKEKAKNAELALLAAEEERINAILAAARPKGASLLPARVQDVLKQCGVTAGMAMGSRYPHPETFTTRLQARVDRERVALEVWRGEEDRRARVEEEEEVGRIAGMVEGSLKARALARQRRARQHKQAR